MIDKCRSSCSKTVTPTIILETQHGAYHVLYCCRVACGRSVHTVLHADATSMLLLILFEQNGQLLHLGIAVTQNDTSVSNLIAEMLAL